MPPRCGVDLPLASPLRTFRTNTPPPRFDPLLQDIVEDAAAGKLGAEDFPYLR